MQRLGDSEGRERAVEHEAVAVFTQQSGLQHHLRQLLDEERNAVRARGDLRRHLGRQRAAAGDARHHFIRVLAAEPRQLQHCDVGLHRPRRRELRAAGQQDELAARQVALDEHADELQRRRVHPVQVFADDQHRVLSRLRVEPSERGLQGLLLLLLRPQVQRRAALRRRQAEKRGEERERRARLFPGGAQRGGEALGRRARIARLQHPLEVLDQRVERAVLMDLRATQLDSHVLLGQMVAQCPHEARLADARLARDDDDLRITRHRFIPTIQQQRSLFLAPHERRQVLDGVEPARCAAFAYDAEDLDRPCHALELLLAERFDVEEAVRQPLGGTGDDDGVGRRDGLHARGNVRRLADNVSALDALPRAHIADDREPGMEPDTDGQRLAAGVHLFPRPRDDLDSRADRPLSVVFMRSGIAEIGQNAIAEPLANVAAAARDRLGAGVVIAAQGITQILRVEDA